jgi:adenylate cyclase
MRVRRPRVKTLALLTSGALIGLVLLARHFGALEAMELDTVDARFSLRGAQTPPAELLIVDMDDATFEELDWPVPRRHHGRLIDRLVKADAAVIVFDVQFTEESAYGPRDDRALEAAIARAGGRVILGTTLVDDRGDPYVLYDLRRIDARAASMLLPTDVDGTRRRIVHSPEGVPALAVAAVELRESRRVPTSALPADGAWIDFRGPRGTIRSVSFVDVLDGRVPERELRGRIVVIGTSAPAEQDLHPTSAGEALMSGAEIHANAIWSVLQDVPLGSVPDWVEVLCIVALGIVPPLAGLRAGRLGAAGIVALSAAGWLVVAWLAFGAGIILPLVGPLAALLLAATGSLALLLAGSDYERHLVRDGFTRFVPASVVGQVLAWLDGGGRPSAESLVCTVVFIDLRGSTTWAEMLPPGRVFDVLNRYSSEMAQAVERHDGTVVDLRGDGILAVFGAPDRRERHADLALAAVREIVGVHCELLNAWVREQSLGEGFRIGIGVSSGAVTSGVVGSREQMRYTIVGDTVHTAARLEDLTRHTPHQALISDRTKGMLHEDASDLEHLSTVTVRGKQVEVVLWGLASSRTDRDAAGRPAASAPA